MKPWMAIPLADCGEPLVPLDEAEFSLETPHPYAALGAPYGDRSPWMLRRSVRDRLRRAQARLQAEQPGWRLHLLDAYRPVAVQAFMVDHTDRQIAVAEPNLSEAERRAKVLTFWALPSPNPATPPPHSTGAALDLTLVDDQGAVVDMGSPFDEPSPRSYPDHFAAATDPIGQRAHRQRQLLNTVMTEAGFRRHPNEWWHFSWGDQLWAWQTGEAIARYGGV